MKPLPSKQQYWANHLQNADAFDGSVADYARHAGVPAKVLYQWRGILRQREALPASNLQARKSFVETGFFKSEQLCWSALRRIS